MLLKNYLNDRGYSTPSNVGREKGSFSNLFFAGIELEIEGIDEDVPDTNPSNWQLVSDNSLRNGGIELITNGPKCGKNLDICLRDLEESLLNINYDISERCSTHVHIDVSDMYLSQILNFILLSCIFEDVLFTLFGSTRKSNTFCLSTKDGGTNLQNLFDTSENIDYLVDRRWSKYSGISLNRIRDLGTVEFRMFHPITKYEDYKRVLTFLFAMKAEAIAMSDIEEIISYKKANSLIELFSRLFPEEEFLPSFEKDIESGIKIVNDVIIHKNLKEILGKKELDLEKQLKEVRKGL